MNKNVHILLELIFPPDQEDRLLHYLTLEKIRRLKCTNPPPHPFITSILSYKKPLVRLLIHKIKYQAHTRALSIGATLLSEEIMDTLNELQQFGEYTHPLLIPLPIHIQRRRERGWNQSELLLKQIQKETEIPSSTKILLRTKDTPSQTSMKNRKERLLNPQGSFSVTKEISLKNKDIIIIDDVTTTGATLKEACDTLKKAGARDVKAITLAH